MSRRNDSAIDLEFGNVACKETELFVVFEKKESSSLRCLHTNRPSFIINQFLKRKSFFAWKFMAY
jgi:hypothetical protein